MAKSPVRKPKPKKEWVALNVGGTGGPNQPPAIAAEILNKLGIKPGEAHILLSSVGNKDGKMEMLFSIVAYVDPAAVTPELTKQAQPNKH